MTKDPNIASFANRNFTQKRLSIVTTLSIRIRGDAITAISILHILGATAKPSSQSTRQCSSHSVTYSSATAVGSIISADWTSHNRTCTGLAWLIARPIMLKLFSLCEEGTLFSLPERGRANFSLEYNSITSIVLYTNIALPDCQKRLM
jgi:hypothetical protein